MKYLSFSIALACVCATALGQGSKWEKHAPPKRTEVQCQTCHACAKPTKTDPCLVQCPRMHVMPGHDPAVTGPIVVEMGEKDGQFGPVRFEHKLHADMSEMSGGCYGCHHYNSTSMAILSCRECHPRSRARADISMPDLKGAYHRQCMDCHRQWNHSTDCKGCHIKPATAPQTAKTDSLKTKIHPEVPLPTKVTYETRNQNGSFVTFFHDDHATRFGLQCADCHRQEGCVRCHDVAKSETANTRVREVKTQRSMDQLHEPCFACHSKDKCESCHVGAPMKAFDHARSAGWPLNRFHRELSCQKCHGEKKRFSKVDTKCSTCHKGFTAGVFRHQITGLKLDGTHSGLECESCHIEMNFGNPPSCAGCHDDKSYPAQRPGTRVAAKP